MSYQNILQALKQIDVTNGSKGKIDEFSSIFVDQFLRDMNIIDEDVYRIHASVGIGNIAKTWWCGIFNYDYYKQHLHINNAASISASKGFYVVYLLNEQRSKLFLSINSASKDVRKSENAIQKKLEINAVLRNQITKKPNYLVSIDGKLSKNQNDLARDYEIGTIIAIEYDLYTTKISNERFQTDLINILEDFTIIKDYLMETNLDDFYINSSSIQPTLLENELTLSNTKDYMVEDSAPLSPIVKQTKKTKKIPLTDNQIERINNRDVSYSSSELSDKKPRAARNPDLANYVLLKENYQCCISKEHKTFLGKSGHYFVVAHHLIPMEFQYLFSNYNIDRTENIVCVCPNCHAAIHYGNREVQIKLLKPLYEASPMKQILKELDLANSFEEFLNTFY